MREKYLVYLHTCPNGKVYVGITRKKPNDRWNNGNGYKTNDHFYKAIKKYGWENIKHEIVFTDLSEEEATEAEKELISMYNSNNPKYGYNATGGGFGSMGFIEIKKEMPTINDILLNENISAYL